ncbi:MAG: MBL fold metallo-hydrolase [Bacteroidetes bacterium]|nr:MBL fold metallo-hydrolase [Bacteroidota bacterium]
MKIRNLTYRSIILTLFSISFFLVLSFRDADQNDSMVSEIEDFIKVHKISENVLIITMGYDAITAIATQKGIVVVDAGISNSLTEKYKKVIEREFDRNDFAYLINTHSHPDHIGGNQVFSNAIIVGHENCLSEISNQWKDPEKIKPRLLKIVEEYDSELKNCEPGSDEWKSVFCQKVRYQSAYNDLLDGQVITNPNVTFTDSLSIFMGDATFNLIYFGKAHSNSDIFIHIPEAKILMSGDLFFPGGRPSVYEVSEKDAQRWVYVMDWIKNRDDEIDIIIGGHGQIMDKKDLEAFNKSIILKKLELVTK